jgi:nitrogen-specific signal transduction histidine kinase
MITFSLVDRLELLKNPELSTALEISVEDVLDSGRFVQLVHKKVKTAVDFINDGDDGGDIIRQ